MEREDRTVTDSDNQILSEEALMTAQEVADFLKVKECSVRRWSREGKLKGYRLGEKGDWRYCRSDLIAFLKQG